MFKLLLKILDKSLSVFIPLEHHVMLLRKTFKMSHYTQDLLNNAC